jgi:hypothetical protein
MIAAISGANVLSSATVPFVDRTRVVLDLLDEYETNSVRRIDLLVASHGRESNRADLLGRYPEVRAESPWVLARR